MGACYIRLCHRSFILHIRGTCFYDFCNKIYIFHYLFSPTFINFWSFYSPLPFKVLILGLDTIHFWKKISYSLTGPGYLSYTNKLQIQRHFVIFILCDFQIWGTERSREGKFGKIRGCDRKVLLILSASKSSVTICALWAGALSCRIFHTGFGDDVFRISKLSFFSFFRNNISIKVILAILSFFQTLHGFYCQRK